MAFGMRNKIDRDARNADGSRIVAENTGNLLPANTRLQSRVDSGSNPTRRKGTLPNRVSQCEVGDGPGVCVVVDLPGVVSADEVELELAPTSLRVDAPSTGHKELRVDLPQYVEPESAVAKFSAKAGTLTVTAAVVGAQRLAKLAAGEEAEPPEPPRPEEPEADPEQGARALAASIQQVREATSEVRTATERVRDGAAVAASDEAAVAAAAAKKKDEGSALFRKGEFASAAERYGAAIELTPNDHTLWGNRSLSHIKRGAWASAARDAAKATELEPAFVKGWGRLVRARMELGQDDAAREALRTGLRLDVTNKELSKLAKELKTRAGAAAATAPAPGSGSAQRERPESLTQNPEQARIKEDVSAGEYVGTLRWDDNTKFMPLPGIEQPLWGLPVDIPNGWEQYMNARLGEYQYRSELSIIGPACLPLCPPLCLSVSLSPFVPTSSPQRGPFLVLVLQRRTMTAI
jgi:tetratricopeptide (TPR) repeat protein